MKMLFKISVIIVIVTSIMYLISINKKDTMANENSIIKLEQEVNKIVVYKSKREMLVYNDNTLLKTYKIALGGQPIGHKEFEGDEKTPEGKYIIYDKNPNSAYHKNLGISYPNENDIQHAAKFNKSAGGDIKIHGLKNGMGHIGDLHRNLDWTLGCIAVTNEEIDELFQFVQIGSEIEIYP